MYTNCRSTRYFFLAGFCFKLLPDDGFCKPKYVARNVAINTELQAVSFVYCDNYISKRDIPLYKEL